MYTDLPLWCFITGKLTALLDTKQDHTMEIFDIAVAGAGPAGCMAAKSAALLGKKVCLLERKSTPGYPARCGEGIGNRGLVLTLDPKSKWIKNDIKTASMISPSGIKVTIGSMDTSHILDRELMDNDLADDAAACGADLRCSSPVTSVERDKEGNYILTGPSEPIKARCLIIADGVESRLARFLGWDTVLKDEDIETCAFARVTSPLLEKSSCLFYTGKEVSPGGYAWIFPRMKGEANVGLGISGTYSEAGKARELLMQFIDRELPGAKVSKLHCGGVPVAKWLRPLVRDGAMLVGDAARQVNCLNGAGIAYGLYAGKLAGQIAAEAITENGVNYPHLKNYEKQWKRGFGKQQDRSFSLKEFVRGLDDSFLDKIAHSFSKEDPNNINYVKIFTKTVARRPLLIFKTLKLFK
ncbi:Digeranylgeranylglycerophospholipid reductase [Chitinispirillum alkaliphilum]|nr:Digeranylgeranylglycerophospholipid reductase [Chitinispirillum alkaliphilum]